MSESKGSPESSTNLMDSSQLIQDSADNVQQSSSLASHDTHSSSSESADLSSVGDDRRDPLLGTKLVGHSLLDAMNVPLESPPLSSGSSSVRPDSSPKTECSVESTDVSSPESNITGEKNTVSREHIHQPSTESKRESDKSLKVGESSFGVDASQEHGVSATHLQSLKINREEQSVEKSQLGDTRASLEKVNTSEKEKKKSQGETSIPYEDISSESVECNLMETAATVSTKDIEKVSCVCPPLSQPDLLSPGTNSSGFWSPSRRNETLSECPEADVQIISDIKDKAPKSEVSETSATPEKVQSSKNVGNLDICKNVLDTVSTPRQRKVSVNSSQKIKEAAVCHSPDSSENEGSSKKLCMSASEEAKVGTPLEAAASTSSKQISLPAFRDYTDENFIKKFKDLLADSEERVFEPRRELYAKTYEKQRSEEKKLSLKEFLDGMDEIYEDFLQAKAFLMTMFSIDLTSIENNIKPGFCNNLQSGKLYSANSLILKDEFEEVITKSDWLNTMWSKYWLVVHFLLGNSDDIIQIFISSDTDRLSYYFVLVCEKFRQFLRNRMEKIKRKEALMSKSDFKHFCSLNSALTSSIIKLDALLNDFYIYLIKFPVITLE